LQEVGVFELLGLEQRESVFQRGFLDLEYWIFLPRPAGLSGMVTTAATS